MIESVPPEPGVDWSVQSGPGKCPKRP